MDDQSCRLNLLLSLINRLPVWQPRKIRHLFSPAEVASSDGELGEPLQGAWSYPRGGNWGSYLAAVCCSENPGGGDEAARADKLLKDGESVQGDVGWKLARCSLAASQDPTSWSIWQGLRQEGCPGLGEIEGEEEQEGRHGSHWSDSSCSLFISKMKREASQIKNTQGNLVTE